MPQIATLVPIILASGSENRKSLLSRSGLQFSVQPADVDENALKKNLPGASPKDKAEALAKAKAKAVSNLHPDALVIGGDQICSLGESIFDKPGSEATAIANLKTLSGNIHYQYSGLALYKAGKCVWSHVETAILTMRELTDTEIESYVAQDQPLAAAGAYKIESLGYHLFTHIEGTSDTIEGLPLLPLLAALREQGAYDII